VPTVDEILLDLAPELSSVDPAARARVEDLASLRTATGLYSDDLRKLAVALLAAHMLTLAERRGLAQVASETVGPLTQSYFSLGGAVGNNPLDATPYGKQLQELQRENIFGPRTRVT
jgi:hypothetical protein